jgi:hypothetical protein
MTVITTSISTRVNALQGGRRVMGQTKASGGNAPME